MVERVAGKEIQQTQTAATEKVSPPLPGAAPLPVDVPAEPDRVWIGPDGQRIESRAKTAEAPQVAASETAQLQQADSAPRNAPPPRAPSDGFERAHTREPDADTGAFARYDLPAHDGQPPPGITTDEAGDMVAAVGMSLGDVLSALVAPESLAFVIDRAAHLSANPSESAILPHLGPEPGKMAAEVLTEVGMRQEWRNQIAAEYGEDMARAVDATQACCAEMFLGQAVLGHGAAGLPSNPGLLFAGLRAAARGESGAHAFSCLGPGGKMDPGALSEGLGRLPVIAEACFEYFIGVSGRLLKGDVGKDIDMLSARLADYKAEKQALIGRIIAREGSMLGLQASMTRAAAEARAAQESAKDAQLAGCIIGLIIVIIVAIIVTVFSCGSGAPAAAGAVAAVTTATVAVASTAAVSATTMMIIAVLTIICAVISIITAIPSLIEATARIARRCGNGELADQLQETCDAVNKWYADNPAFQWTLLAIQLVASLIMMIVTFGAGSASLVNTITSLVSAAGMLVQGACQVAAAAMMKDAAKFEHELSLLRSQLATVEAEIKALMLQIQARRDGEDAVKDDIENSQELEGRIMTNVQKAADSLSELRKAVAIF